MDGKMQEHARRSSITKATKLAGSLVMVLAVVGVTVYAQRATSQDSTAFMQKQDTAGRVLFTPEKAKKQEGFKDFKKEIHVFNKVKGDGLDASDIVCRVYGGIDHPNMRGCCNPKCGKGCGAEDCWDYPGGASECCEGSFPHFCDKDTNAPCLLRFDKLVDVYADKLCGAHGGIDHPTSQACCPEECGEYCGGGEEGLSKTYGSNCANAPFGGSKKCCMSSMLTKCGVDGAKAPCLLIQAPIALSYSVPSSITTDEQVSYAATFAGGDPADSFAVDPPLPGSMTLDPASGQISGSSADEVEMATYHFTAKNAGGEASADITFAIKTGVKAPQIAYDLPDSFTIGAEVAQPALLAGGSAPTSCSVEPALPGGLSLGATSGAIAGTPTEEAKSASYVVTCSNKGGEGKATVKFSVIPTAPAALAYSGVQAIYHPGQSVALSPEATGGPGSYSVKPALPKALTLDAATGDISGTLKEKDEVDKETYVITDANAGGSASAEITFAVETAAGKSAGGKKKYAVGDKVKVTADTSGFSASEFKVEPDLPKELTLNKDTGAITGTLAGHKKPLPAFKETAYGIEGGKSVPEASWKLKFPIKPAGAFPWWIIVLLLVVVGIILFFCCKEEKKEEKTYTPLPEPPKPVLVLTWDTPRGPVTTNHMEKNLNLRFALGTAPLKVSRDMGNLGDLGVEVGWGLKQANQIDLTKYGNISQLGDILKKEMIGQMEVVLTFTQGSGAEKSVYAEPSKKPLGIRFSAKLPIAVQREQDITRSLGIQVGWALKAINGENVTGIKDYAAVNAKLKATEVGFLEVPMTWDSPKGDVTVYATRKPLGLKFPSEAPIKILEENEGHGKEIGVEIGMSLKAINGEDVTKITTFEEVNNLMRQHIMRL